MSRADLMGRSRSRPANARTAWCRLIALAWVVILVSACGSNEATPTPPTVSVEPATATSASLTWGRASGQPAVDGYLIERDGVEVATLAGNATTYLDEDLAPGSTYRYTIVAVTGSERTSLSDGLVVTTFAPSPVDLAISSWSGTSPTLRWSPPADCPAPDTYTIVRDGVAVDTVDGATASYTDRGLMPASAIAYQVAATWGDQASAPSGALTVTTPVPIPGGLSVVTSTTSSVTLRWSDPPDSPTPDRYEVTRNGSVVGTVVGTTTEYLDAGLAPGSSNAYQVTATWGPQRSSPTDALIVATVGPSPANLRQQAVTRSSVTLRWSPPPNAPSPDAYVILRDGQEVGTVSSDATAFKHTGLAPATSFEYQVAAVWGDQQSAPTPILAIKTQTPPLSAARLTGPWSVKIKVVKTPGGRASLKKGKTWTETWTINPRCAAGACRAVVDVEFGPPGFSNHWFTVKLARTGVRYSGSTKERITTCGSPPFGVDVKNTVTLRLKVTKAAVDDGTWVATRWTGTMVLRAPYTSTGMLTYCPAQSWTMSLRGSG